MKMIIVALISLCAATGCSPEHHAPLSEGHPAPKIKSDVADWRHGSDVCELHKIKMDTVIGNGLAGPAPSFPPDYYDAKEKTFPHCGIQYPPALYSPEKGKIYVCPKCEQARNAYWKLK